MYAFCMSVIAVFCTGRQEFGFGFCCACERGSPFMSRDPSIFPVIRALSEKFQGLLILNKERKAV